MRYRPVANLLLAIVSYIGLQGCNNRTELSPGTVLPANAANSNNSTPAGPHAAFTIRDFYSQDSLLSNITDSIFNTLDDNERAAQMIMPATGEFKKYGIPFPSVLRLYRNKQIGGVLFLKGHRALFKEEIDRLNAASKKEQLFPAIFSCDAEPTLFHKKFIDADSFPPASALNAGEVTQVAGRIAKTIKEMGFHWNFAPVVDIAVNQEIISTRSFGNDPSAIVRKTLNFIAASDSFNIASTIKHFPGHGAVKGDSHKGIVYIDSVMSEAATFRRIIQLSPPVAVMVGHIALRNCPGYPSNDTPSSLSYQVVTTLLKDSFEFKGLVISDAMNMGAVKGIANADLKAIMAGVDIVVYPTDIPLLHRQICELLKDPVRSVAIKTSIKRVIRLKICLQLIPWSKLQPAHNQ